MSIKIKSKQDAEALNFVPPEVRPGQVFQDVDGDLCVRTADSGMPWIYMRPDADGRVHPIPCYDPAVAFPIVEVDLEITVLPKRGGTSE